MLQKKLIIKESSILAPKFIELGYNYHLSTRASREALRWKARKGGSRWGRGGKKASL
jgi:hypothetical protein